MIPFATAPGLAGLRHGFFGREGGVSAQPYDSLNVGTTTGDAPESVIENRRRIAAALDIDPACLVNCRQVHSNRVLTVAAPFNDALPEADGLVTRETGLALAILTADCTPILLADHAAGVIGAAHAGWRGACDGVVAETISAMEALGANRKSIHAAIGPTISSAHYEVGPDFVANILASHPGADMHFTQNEGARPHFDLPGFVAAQLAGAGIVQVETIGGCTHAQPDRYFSHRHATHQGTTTGRQLAVIVRG